MAVALVLGSVTSMLGCAVDDNDLQRWETTLEGPKRLSAVTLHTKYPDGLRVQAALSLIRMKPRKGIHVGLERLVLGTLLCTPKYESEDEPCHTTRLTAEGRATLLKDLVPLMVEELKKPSPKAQQDGKAAVDPSVRFKDAAFMMLTNEGEKIISDPALRTQLTDALREWAMVDFERKLADRNQAFGMEQLLTHIGPTSVEQLPELLTRDSRNLAKLTTLIAKIGDAKTKDAAGKKLADIAKFTNSDAWRKETLPQLEEANKKAGFTPTKKQLDKQMADYQVESVVRVFASMKKVGGPTATNYSLAAASNKDLPEKVRQSALASLEGHIDRKNPDHLKKLVAILQQQPPPLVVDQAFRRIKELPRAQVATALYKFFESKEWKVRRLAAASLLTMSETKHIDEFLEHLGRQATENFNLPEVITYGAYLSGLKGGDNLKKLEPHMRRGRYQSRLAAIAYYYEKGTKKDLGALTPFLRDGTKIKECDEDGGCDWNCLVVKGKTREPKEIKTIADFVNYCVKPKMESTEPTAAKKKSTDQGDKKGEKKEEEK